MGEVAELLGRPPLPPRWALGFIQSTRHFDDTAELRALPRTIREKRIPCDGAGLPLELRRGARLEPRGRAPRVPARALAGPGRPARRGAAPALRGDHPRVSRCSTRSRRSSPRPRRAATCCRRATSARAATGRPPAAYRDGQRYLDFSDPAARAWWWAAASRAARRSAWPAGGSTAARARPRARGSTRGDGTLLHNIYDRFRQQAFAEGEAADRPDQRVFLLCRSGAAGMQRLGRGVLVGRHQQRLRDAGGADPAGAEHRALRGAVLGHRRGRVLPPRPRDRRALRALVPARRVLPGVPLARLGLARARAVGARARGRGDLPPLRRAPLPAPALHLHARVAGAHARPAPDAPAGPQLPRRSARLAARAASTSGATICWSPRSPARARRRGRSTCPRAAGTTSGRARATRARAASRSRRRSTGCPCSCGRARSCRWGRSSSTPASRRRRSRC